MSLSKDVLGRELIIQNKPKNQHHVPQVYLRYFCDQHGYIYVLDKVLNRMYSTGTAGIAVEKDFYTIDSFDNQYVWEQYYAKNIEPELSTVFSKIIKTTTNLLTREQGTVIGSTEKWKLAVLMIVQLMRGKAARDYMKRLYFEKYPLVLDKASKHFPDLNPDDIDRLALNLEDRLFMPMMMHLSTDEKQVRKFASFLADRVFIFFKLPANESCITSDNPVMFLSRIENRAAPFTYGVADALVDIYYPISPQVLLCAYHHDSFLKPIDEYDCKVMFLKNNEQDKMLIDYVNRKQFEQSYRQIYGQKQTDINIFQ